MHLTDYHAKYYAHELTKRCPSDSVEKLTAALMDSQVDLKPHQVDAALFAFRSPLSKGAILADEVGLGKTIEAGIVLSQKWAERKRKILVIAPSSLRMQWGQELADKFYLPSTVLDSKLFKQVVKAGSRNPFDAADIVICSYYFARNKAAEVANVNWDLVVIDEAHRLRNVYKPGNMIANDLKKCLAHAPKLLLIIISAYATVAMAVKCMKLGAFDYIPKPFKFVEFERTVWSALAYAEGKRG